MKLLALGFATSGILISPDLPVVGTKLALPDLPLVLFVLATVVAIYGRRVRLGAPLRAVVLIALAFVVHGVLSAVVGSVRTSADPIAAITVANYLYGFALTFCVAISLRSFDDVDFALRAWLVGGLVVAGFAFWGVIGGAPEWVFQGYRVKSTLRGVNQMQSYLAPVLLISCFLLYLKSAGVALRITLAAIIPMCFVALLVTGSRSTMLFLALIGIGVVAYAVINARRHPVLSPLVIAVLAGAMMLMGVVASGVLLYGPEFLPEGTRAIARPIMRFQQMAAASADLDALETLGPRGEQMRIVLAHWHEHPILGIGPGLFKEAFDHHHEIHNTYLAVLVEHGVVGLMLLLALIGFTAWLLVTAPRPAEQRTRLFRVLVLAVLVVVCAYGITNFGLRQRVFWLALGLAGAMIRLLHDEARLRRPVFGTRRAEPRMTGPPAAAT